MADVVRIISARKATRSERALTKKMPSDIGFEEELVRLAAMSDDDIDTSDIPEITDEQWKTGRRGLPRAERIELMLNPAVIKWLKAQPGGDDLETVINHILLRHLSQAMRNAPST